MATNSIQKLLTARGLTFAPASKTLVQAKWEEAVVGLQKANEGVKKAKEDKKKAEGDVKKAEVAVKKAEEDVKKVEGKGQSENRGDGDAAVAKTAAIKNIQKSLTARILKSLDDEESAAAGGCNVSYVINFNNGVSSAPESSSRFAAGMNGDEDLGEDIIMKGEPYHYRDAPPRFDDLAYTQYFPSAAGRGIESIAYTNPLGNMAADTSVEASRASSVSNQAADDAWRKGFNPNA